jgi:hypothetical protein
MKPQNKRVRTQTNDKAHEKQAQRRPQPPHLNKSKSAPTKSTRLVAAHPAANGMTGFLPKSNSSPGSDCEGILPSEMASE